LLRENKNTKAPSDASKEADLEVNAGEIKYIFISLRQNAGQKRNMNISNKSFEKAAKFQYLGGGGAVTNQN
jgi:hypothetical protein